MSSTTYSVYKVHCLSGLQACSVSVNRPRAENPEEPSERNEKSQATNREYGKAASHHNSKAKPEQPEKSMATTSRDYKTAFDTAQMAWVAGHGVTVAVER